MNRLATFILFAIACSLGLSGCGHKGKLKTPMEAAKYEAEKQKKADKKAAEQSTNPDAIATQPDEPLLPTWLTGE